VHTSMQCIVTLNMCLASIYMHLRMCFDLGICAQYIGCDLEPNPNLRLDSTLPFKYYLLCSCNQLELAGCWLVEFVKLLGIIGGLGFKPRRLLFIVYVVVSLVMWL